MHSFHNDPALKARVAARVRCAAELRAQAAANAADDDSSLRASFLLSPETDASACAMALGLPKALPALLDILGLYLHRDVAALDALATDLVERIPVGADLQQVPTRLLLDLLEDPRLSSTDSAAVAAALDTVVALHCRMLSGEAPTRQEWKAARELATGVVDADAYDRATLAGRMIEAAAWPVPASTTVLCDVFRAALEVEQQRRVEAIGWTASDQQTTDAQLEQLWELTEAERARGEPVDFQQRFMTANPALCVRHDAMLAAGAAAIPALIQQIASRLLALVGEQAGDSLLWLEDIDGERAMAQVHAWN